MKTDKYNDLRIGDRYDEGAYLLAVHADIQTLRYVLDALIDKVTMLEVNRECSSNERRFLRAKLEEK